MFYDAGTFPKQKITSVLCKRQPDLTVIVDHVCKGRNITAIFRTCDTVGIDTLHVVEPGDGYQHFRGTALGSHKWIETRLYKKVNEPIRQLQEVGFQLAAAHLSS